MGKTPDEIKKGLEYISIKDVARKLDAWEDGIPYDYVEDAAADALALIQQLEYQNGELLKTVEMLKAEIEEYEESANKCCYESICSARITKLESLCQRLSNEKERLEAERDAAVSDLSQCTASHCPYCKHWDRPESAIVCINCRNGTPRCKQHFEWRGVTKEE